jgi:hypothetical protein
MRMMALIFVGALCVLSEARAETTRRTLPPANTILIVDAKPEQTAAFDRALRQQIHSSYERYGLGCSVDYLDGLGDEGCSVMRAGNPIPDDLEYLVYYFSDSNKELRAKFEVARRVVQKKFPRAKLLLTFRHHEERAPDCSIQPQPCVSVPYCQQYGNCSTQSASCQKC